ncbi:MAG: hypothetical protein ACHQFW_09505 [Chitinophagales bacterium]
MKVFNIILGATIVFFVVMFFRCEKVTEITELVKNTEKIQITFYNDSLPDTYIEITDKSEIRKFDNYISTKETPVFKCGYDGQILFFMNEDVSNGKQNSIVMEFNLKAECRHVAYNYAGGLQTKEITDKGVEYLNGIK